ncbi:MAG: efflux RND transporter permease subunit [Bacteroidota bacterium]
MKTIIKKYTFLFISGVVALLLFSVSQLPKLTINPGFDEYIPDNVGNRAHLNQLDSIFGGNEKIIVILNRDSCILNPESFERVQLLVDDLKKVQGVEHTMSMTDIVDIKIDDEGFTTFNPIVDSIPSDQGQLHSLKQDIRNSEMGSRFVSSDFQSTALILTKSDVMEDQTIIAEIEETIENNPGKEEVYISGQSYLRNAVKSYIKKDLLTLLPTSLALMVLILFLSFREWKGVVLPFIVVVLSIVFSFGLMAVLGWEISIVSLLLPVMLVAIANDYGIHLINLYQEKCRTETTANMGHLAVMVYRELRKPILITGLTTIGGMLGLLSHKMAPAAQLGILASIGIGLALAMSLFLIPVLLSLYKKPVQKPQHIDRPSITEKILSIFAKWVNFHPKTVVASFGIATLISISGIFLLRVDTNVEGYFPRHSEIRKGIDLTNQQFGGSQYVSVLFRGNMLSPDFLNRMEEYTGEIRELPDAGHVISPVTFMKELSKGIYTPDEPEYGTLPRSEAEAAQYLEMASFTGFGNQLGRFIDINNANARILVSMKDGSNLTGKTILNGLRNITKDDPQLGFIAGPGLSKIQIAEMVIQGQISSLLLAFIIILFLLSVIFKSARAGIKGSLPLLVATIFLFGFMGFFNISLDIVTALLSSIMIGVGIDYTIHFLWRYKAEYAVRREIRPSIWATLTSTGRGIIFNAFSVMAGFSVLVLSGFAPLRFFGGLVVISIFSCLISALLLIPAIVSLTRPKFLEPGKTNNE